MPKRGAAKSSAAAVAGCPRKPTVLDAVAQINSIKLQQLSLMKEAKKLKEENEELCKRLVQAEEICKRLGRAEQEAVRQQIAIEQPVQVAAGSSQMTSQPVVEVIAEAVEIKEKDGKMIPLQKKQDKGEPVDDQVMVQLPECYRRSVGLLFWSADPICDVVTEVNGADKGIGGNAEVVVELVAPSAEESKEEGKGDMTEVKEDAQQEDKEKEKQEDKPAKDADEPAVEEEEQETLATYSKIPVFDNNGPEFLKWSREAMRHMDSVSEGLSAFLSGALDVDDALNGQEGDTEIVVLRHSQEKAVSVTDSELEKMSSQVYYLLIDLTDGESLELVVSAGEGQGLEAWRKLNRRWDPGATGSVDMLWWSIFRPKKARVEDLEASIERLEDLMRRYVAKRPTKGNSVLSSFTEETKIKCLLKLLPEGLEQYVRPDKFPLSSYSSVREEVIRCAEELLVMEEYGCSGKGRGEGEDLEEKGKSDEVEDEQETSTRPKGKSVTDMWKVKCHRCKNWGHYARDCPSECNRESSGEFDKKMIQCYHCWKWGHYAKDCMASKADDREEERRSWKNKIQCYNCQKWGHYAKECWRKKTDDGWYSTNKQTYPRYNPPPPPPVQEPKETVKAETVCVACIDQKKEEANSLYIVKEADAIYRNHRAERDKYEERLKEEAKMEVHAAEETVEVNVVVEVEDTTAEIAEVVSAQGAEETVVEEYRQSQELGEEGNLVARGKQAIEQVRETWMRSWTAVAAMSGFTGAQSVREDEEATFQMVNITWTQLQMIVVCMIVLIALAVWISRRCTRSSHREMVDSTPSSRSTGPLGRALSAGYPSRERSVSSESSRSRSPEDPRVTAYIQNPRAKAYRQRAQENLRRRRSSMRGGYLERTVVYPVSNVQERQRSNQEVAEPEPEIDSEMRDISGERILENGESYTYVEFQRFFGAEAQRQWSQAPTRDFEAEESEARVDAVVRNEATSMEAISMAQWTFNRTARSSRQSERGVIHQRGATEQSASSSTVRPSLFGGPIIGFDAEGNTVETHTVPEEIANDWQTYGRPQIQRVPQHRSLAYTGNDEDEVITIGARTFTRVECRQRGWLEWASLPSKGRGKGGELRSLEYMTDATRGNIVDKALKQESWLRLNLDTGASIHAFPSEMGVKYEEMGEYNTPESRKQYDMYCNDWYTTASGEEIPDMGQLKLTLEDVGSGDQTREVKMVGNVTSVHKCLMSASKLCKDGKQEIWLNGREGGVVFPSDGPIAEGLARAYENLVRIHGTSTVIPVYLEQGVYNVYFKLIAKEKLERDESPISEDQIVFPDNEEVENTPVDIEAIRRQIGRIIDEEEAAASDGRRPRSRSRGRGSVEDIVTDDRNMPPRIHYGSWQFRQVRRNLVEEIEQPNGTARQLNSRTQRTLPLTAEQMREMGLRYIIPSRYAADSSTRSQEQTTARRADEGDNLTDQRRTQSEDYLRSRILEVRGQAEAILESRAREAMEAEDRAAETEGESAVRRLLERRQSEAEAEAILERIARDMGQPSRHPSQP